MKNEIEISCEEYKPIVSKNLIEIPIGENRHHSIKVEEREDGYWLSGIVLKRQHQKSRGKLSILIWKRNRAANLAGFRFTKKGDIIGECFVPKAGLTKEEYDFCLSKLARECNRMEYVLTGEDNQ